MRGWMIGLALTLFVAVGLAIAAVVAVTASDSSTPIVELEPGTCFELPDPSGTDPIESVATVDCDEPHLAEVVAVGTLGSNGREYPSEVGLFEQVDQACRQAGVVKSDRFGLLPIAPTEAMWASFDGQYLCVAVPFGGEPVTGSALAG